MPTEVLLPEVCLGDKLIVASQVVEDTALVDSLLKLVTKPYKLIGPTRVSLQCLKVVSTAHPEITDIWTTLKVLVSGTIVVHAMLSGYGLQVTHSQRSCRLLQTQPHSLVLVIKACISEKAMWGSS